MDKHDFVKHLIAQKLLEIEDICAGSGLRSINKFTFFGRDDQNINMYLLVSNEGNNIDSLPTIIKKCIDSDDPKRNH
jgi:hypothetical protein